MNTRRLIFGALMSLGLVLSVKSVALSTQGASGQIVRPAFEELGIAEAMAPKVVLISDMTAPEAVVQGRAELAFTQISEILDTPQAQMRARGLIPQAAPAAPSQSKLIDHPDGQGLVSGRPLFAGSEHHSSFWRVQP